MRTAPLLLVLILGIVLMVDAYRHPVSKRIMRRSESPKLIREVTAQGQKVKLYEKPYTPQEIGDYVAKKYKALLSPNHSQEKRSDSIPVSGAVFQGEYWAPVYIGSPAQTFQVQLDTGSSLMAVPNVGCVNISCIGTPKECPCALGPDPPYNTTASSTSTIVPCQQPQCSALQCSTEIQGACYFNSTYGDGSGINGILYTDSVHFGNFSVNAMFGGILQENTAFEVGAVDGIMGLAYAGPEISCLPNCVTPLFDSIVQQNKISNIFTMFLNTTGDSYIELGGHPNATSESNILYTDVTRELYYVVDQHDMQLFGDTVSGSDDPGLTIVDSGTTLWIVPENIFESLALSFLTCSKKIFGICQWTPESETIVATCMDAASFWSMTNNGADYPDIFIRLEGAQLRIPPSNYLVEQEYNGTTTVCFGIQPLSGQQITILGDVVMKGFTVIFDRESSPNRVGWMREGYVEHYDSSSKIAGWVIVAAVFGAVACCVCLAVPILIWAVVSVRRRPYHAIN